MKKFLSSKTFLSSFAVLWFVAVAIPVGYLMGAHQAFNGTTKSDALSEKITSDRSVLHLVGADCLCSEKLSNYLSSRGPLKNINEKVIVVGHNPALVNKLKAAHFTVEEMASDVAYERYSLKALPQMILYDKKTAVYSGGYSEKRSPASTSDYDDLKIIDQFFKGHKSEARPIYGCANGANFRKQVDPLNLKY